MSHPMPAPILQVLSAHAQRRTERQARQVRGLLPHVLLLEWARNCSARIGHRAGAQRKHAEVHGPSVQCSGGEAGGSTAVVLLATNQCDEELIYYSTCVSLCI